MFKVLFNATTSEEVQRELDKLLEELVVASKTIERVESTYTDLRGEPFDEKQMDFLSTVSDKLGFERDVTRNKRDTSSSKDSMGYYHLGNGASSSDTVAMDAIMKG